MNPATLGELFLDLCTGVLILDEDDQVVWHGGTLPPIREERFVLPPAAKADGRTSLATSEGRHFELWVKPFTTDQAAYSIVLFHDQTDLTNNARARLYCLERIIESLHEGVLMSDCQGRIVLFNKAQGAMEGLNSDHVVGRYLWDAYNYDPELSEHRLVFKTGVPIIERYRARIYVKGIPQYVAYSTYPIIKDGVPLAVFSISRNETKLKELLHETIELKRRLHTQDRGDRDTLDNGTTYTFENIKGDSPRMTRLIREAQNIAVHDTDVLLVGETGTGKEVFAQSIHNHSARAKHPFVAVNCAAIPETLLESMLFGTTRGAYTGAVDQIGLFEHAGHGTLFLDEVNSMPISLQAKLTRVLEERAVRRLGTVKVTRIHCRVISATNEDPLTLIEDNRLRQDLYFRLAGTCLTIPPLREDRADILTLTHYFIEHFNAVLNKHVKGLAPQLESVFLRYDWPGNIRELRHAVENLMIRADDDQEYLDLRNLPAYLGKTMLHGTGEEGLNGRHSLDTVLQQFERDLIQQTLQETNANVTKAAERLGITRQSLQYRMKKFQIVRNST